MAYISKITLPNGQTYDLKDAEARAQIAELVASGVSFIRSTNADNTPLGVTWDDGGTLITGTLAPLDSENKPLVSFYLVPNSNTQAKDSFAEYKVVNIGSEAKPNYVWEKLGDTEIDFSHIADYLDITITQPKDSVLGADTTFTTGTSSVTFSGGTNDSFVKSYPGTTSKLETTSIKGVGTDVTFNAVSGTPGTVTATNTVLGTATSASKIVTETKTATHTSYDTPTTASKATAGTAITLAKPASSATSVSRIALSTGNTSILETATVNGETLVIGSASVDNSKSITGINGSQSITPYTFTDVTVPVILEHEDVSIASVKTNTNVTVPVISSNNAVTASAQITVSATTAATSAGSATTVATGSLKSNDTVGATIMTGLGTPTKANAITNVGTGTAAAQTITVGTNDLVNAVTNVSATIIDKE